MNKEILFAQKLGEIRKLAKEQGNYVTKEQIADAFAELEFQEDQFQMVYDYLTKHKIGIDEPVDLDEYLSEDEVDYLKMYDEVGNRWTEGGHSVKCHGRRNGCKEAPY